MVGRKPRPRALAHNERKRAERCNKRGERSRVYAGFVTSTPRARGRRIKALISASVCAGNQRERKVPRDAKTHASTSTGTVKGIP